MPVSDIEFNALLALLRGRSEEHARLLDQLDPAEKGRGYGMLIAAALLELAEKRFIRDGKYVPDDEVVAYVARARSISDTIADELDPRIAERVLFAALDQGDLDGLDPGEIVNAQLWLLAVLVRDEQFSTDSEVESFLKVARRLADDILET
jgi:broad specificity phosphatase PhoE